MASGQKLFGGSLQFIDAVPCARRVGLRVLGRSREMGEPCLGNARALSLPSSSLGSACRRLRKKSTIRPVWRERGVVVIIAYKLVKGVLWMIFATALVVSIHLGLADRVVGISEVLRLHARPWSLEAASLVLRASTRHALWTLTLALYADGVLTLVEGWALFHGKWWGAWLVVVATGSLLPFEVNAFARHPHAVRAFLLLVNALIVVYLARVASQHARSRPPERPDPEPGAFPPGASPPG